MSNYDNEILAYQEDAEDRYDDYSGYQEEYFDTGFEGNEDTYYDDDYGEDHYVEEMDGDYDDYKASSIGRIDPNDRTLTVVVKNTSDKDQDVEIFGAYRNVQPIAGVTIEVAESSHQEVRAESMSNPFLIEGMKMSVSDPLQFDNVLNIVTRTATGSHASKVFQPRNSTSPQNFSSNMIDTNFSMEVTGQNALKFKAKKGATIVFTFTIKARANMANLLKGRNVAELSTTPRTTGLPQIDLLRKRSVPAFGMKPPRKKVVRRSKRPRYIMKGPPLRRR